MCSINIPICERCYHQTIRTSKILILIDKRHICHRDPGLVEILFEIEATLFQPLKIVDRLNVHATLFKWQKY